MADVIIRIYIKQQGRDRVSLRNLPTQLESLWKKTGIQLNQLGYRVVDKMVEYLEPRRRPKNYPGVSNLGKALRQTVVIKEIDDKTYKVSIGNINYLNQVAPYWKVINYGGSPWKGGGRSGKKFPLFGFFGQGNPPTRGKRGEAWYGVGGYVAGQGYGTPYMLQPKHPIEGKRYINKAINWLNREWAYLTRNVPIWYMREMRGIFLTGKTSEMTRERLGIKTR